MKKFYLIWGFLAVFLTSSYAQVIPKGINYQAMARNLDGEIIPNQRISIKVYLFGTHNNQRINHYSEIHEVTTNHQGLFNLTIGEGSIDQGEYGLIPWNTQNIWMEVAIKDKERSGFATVSSSKLQAVPYAIHAGSAGRLAGKNKTLASGALLPDPGVVSDTWSVFGNAMTNTSGNPYHINSLGTTDMVDLILITDNVQRFTILAGGDIITKLNFEVGQNLKVGQNLNTELSATIGDSLIAKKNVLFNTLGGSTINYGPFTVAKMSTTLLSGKLTVDLATDLNAGLTVNGPADLNDSLFVNNLSPTKLTGTLQVDSTTNLNDALNVNKISPVVLSGSLLTDSCATFNDKVKILSQYSTDTAGIIPSGSLQVGGGAYIKENLYIGGVAKFGGPVGFGGAVSITDGTQSTSPSTGALKVSGGVGIGLNLNVGGAAMIDGMTTIKDLTESIDSTTGALKILGGVGIRKRLNAGGAATFGSSLQVAGAATLNNILNVTSSDNYIAHFTNTTNQHGISIEISTNPDWDNNYLEFRKNDGGVVGRIEGESAAQYMMNTGYLREIDKLNSGIFSAGILAGIAVVSLGLAAASLIAAIASFTTCIGLGIMACAPLISFIVKGALDIAAGEIAVVTAGHGIDVALEMKNNYIAYKAARIGVTYESGAGDYAEWLPKANREESFLPGHVVGLKNGKISKFLEGADKLLVISTQPIVLGNMPEQSKELAYEKVAFMGQVPVHVLGKVEAGDYILPSGNNDGLGRALSPSAMKAEDYANIIGVAWSASEKGTYKMINVAIGLNTGDISKVVVEQKNKIEALSSKINKRNTILAGLVPGYKQAAGIKEMEALNKNKPDANETAYRGYTHSGSNATPPASMEITNEQISDMLTKAEKILAEQGMNTDGNPFWKRLKTEPGFKDQFIQSTQNKLKMEIMKQTELLKPRINDK